MRIVAVVCNVVLFAITFFVVLTEGIPSSPPFLILTLLPLSVPILSLVVLLRGGMTREGRRMRDDPSPGSTLVNRVTVFFSIVLAALSCWAATAQYPYPEGNSVIPFALLMVCTPISTLVVLLRSGNEKGQEQQPLSAPPG